MDKLKAASFSIGANLLLTLAKLYVGMVTGSLGIIAEFLHSALDLVASVFAYLGIRKASEPADRTHPYGHEKFENLSALMQTALIAVSALWVGYEAYNRLVKPLPVESTELGLVVMAAALAIDFLISRFLHSVSEREGSVALEADAYHFTSDLWSTSAVIIGLVSANLGFLAGDSLAAIGVALLMLRLSYTLGKKALFVLLDKGASQDEVERIAAMISKTRGIRGYHKLRARHMGSRLVVDLHIQLDERLSLKEAHRISHALKGKITAEVPAVKDVTIHIEPYEGE